MSQLSTPSLPRLAYKGIPVVTTESLAQAYEAGNHRRTGGKQDNCRSELAQGPRKRGLFFCSCEPCSRCFSFFARSMMLP